MKKIWLSSSFKVLENERISVELEEPLKAPKRHDLVVCVAPLYIYTDWQILLTGIETWFALGATLFVFPIQSASNDTYLILKAYESQGNYFENMEKINKFRKNLIKKLAKMANFIGYKSQWFSFIAWY